MRALRAALAGALVLSSLPARALENDALAPVPDDGRVVLRSEVLDRPIYPNLEGPMPDGGRPWCQTPPVSVPAARPTDDPCASRGSMQPTPGYRLSIDGQPLGADGRTDAESQRCADVRLAAAGIRVQSDEHGVRKVLSVGAWPDRAWLGEPIEFDAYWNYTNFILQGEARLFPLGASPKSRPFATVPVDRSGRAEWTPSARDALPGFRLVLRVYDRAGRFDETEPYDVLVSSGPHESAAHPAPPRERAVVYGKNSLALDRIPLSGAKVTVSGDRVAPGSRVYALGREAPVSPDGAFAVEEILPPGRHDVTVKIDGPAPLQFTRPIYVAQGRWFYVAMADLTFGGNRASANAALVTGDNDHYAHSVFADGRAAFYLKGEVKGDWLLTASADTQEQPVNQLFSGMQEKDPRYLLRRLDPDRYYPVYGDDSTMTEDAPTQGKFYVRLEKGETNILWGNYAVRLRQNELAQIDRVMYGGRLHAVTPRTTKYGERKSSLDGYVGIPGTLAAREEFRGTGGSLFYLRHLDITAGSDLVSVEVRDKDSGLLLRTRDLARGQDYDIDPLQGRLVLDAPLPSLADDGLVVRSGDLSGNPVFLVIRYDYQPDLTAVDDYATGGRASTWLGDHVEVGATGSSEKDGLGGENRLLGADATVRYTPTTYLKAMGGQTKGPGSGAQGSIDGGFTFNSVPQTSVVKPADAARVEGAVQMSDLHAGSGRATGYWQDKQAGYAAPGQLTTAATETFGGTVSQPLPGKTTLDAKYDQNRVPGGTRAETLNLDLRKGWGERWTTDLGSRSNWSSNVAQSSSAILSSQNGARTDVALQIGYDTHKRWSAYGFGQGTANETQTQLNNTRYGLGGKLSLSDRWTLTGEGSNGNGHAGGKVGTEARVSQRTSVYTTYQLESDRTDTSVVGRTGQLVSGVKTRYSDSTTIFGEERWQNGTGPTSLTHAYGLDVAALDGWHWGLTGERGTISDPNAGDIERTAATGSVGITRKDVKWSSALEYRDERGGTIRTTWLTRNSLGYQVSRDWRLITKFSLSLSGSSQGAFFVGRYTEGIFGWAYRPADNDKLNALFKYTYFADLASPGQLTATGATPDFQQRSHILALDAAYDLFPALTVGGKYALRVSQVAFGRDGASPWFSSTAHLGVLRLDWHVVRHWDAIVEGRHLRVVEARDSRTGALLAIYRHIGRNLKFGGGYNFTSFSDDLTDLSYRSHGWFVNVLANF